VNYGPVCRKYYSNKRSCSQFDQVALPGLTSLK